MVINVCLNSAMVILVIGDYQWLLVTLRIYFKTMVIMVIDGYQWLFMVINVCLNSAMVFLVIGGYQWLSVVISDIENNFHIFQDNGYHGY